MEQLNSIFEKMGETPIKVEVPYGNKKHSRIVGIKRLSRNIWAGTVTRNKKVTGRWAWNISRFDNPVFISQIVSANGKPKRYTKISLCEVIKSLVNKEIEKLSAPEITAIA